MTKSDTVWLLAVLLAQTTALQWAPGSPSNNTVFFACANGNISIPWSVSAAISENITSIEWYFQGRSDEMIGMYSHGNFLAMPSFAGGRVEFLTNAGLVLHHVTTASKGTYSVAVNGVDRYGDYVKLHQFVVLDVQNHLQTTDGHLHADQQTLTQYDAVSDQEHLVLRCGNFTFTSPPPFTSQWTTPTGETMVSATYRNGQFLLLLPNPVTGGQYTCHVPQQATCDQTGEDAVVRVDETASQMKLMRAELDKLKKQSFISAANAHCQGEQRVVFSARPSANVTQVVTNSTVLFSDVLVNEGGAYNPSTGIVTLPADGMYYLVFSTAVRSNYTIASFDHANLNMNVHTASSFFFSGCSVPMTHTLMYCYRFEQAHKNTTLYVESSDFDLFNYSQTTFSVSYLTPCFKPEMTVFNSTTVSIWSNSTSPLRFNGTIAANRFSSYDSETGLFVAPFDGAFYFDLSTTYFGNSSGQTLFSISFLFTSSGVSVEHSHLRALEKLRAGEDVSLDLIIDNILDREFDHIDATMTVYYVSPCLHDSSFHLPYPGVFVDGE